MSRTAQHQVQSLCVIRLRYDYKMQHLEIVVAECTGMHVDIV